MARALFLLPLLLALGCKAASGPGGPPSAPELCEDPRILARAADRANETPVLADWAPGTPATERTQATLTRAARAFLEACGAEEAIALTRDLVRFPTVSAREDPATGPAFTAMRRYLEGWARAAGFGFESTPDNGAWLVTTGTGAPSLAFVMHADVVPVDEEGAPKAKDGLPPGWTRPPFALTRDSGRLYGRGTEDDKGPIAAVLVSLHTLKRFGLLPEDGPHVQAIMGTGEESSWAGMRAFVDSRPQAPHVISLDASYPVVVAESGFVAWTLELPRGEEKREEGCLAPRSVKAGQFLTQVPGEARLEVGAAPGAAQKLRAAAEAAKAALADERLRFEVQARADTVTLTTFGEAVHSSEADAGANAMWLLARAGAELELCPGAVQDALRLVAGRFAGDHWGERLGLAYAHDVMGRLLVAPTVLRTEAGKVVLRINMRRPAGRTTEAFSAAMDAALADMEADAPGLVEAEDGRYVGEPALVDPRSKLVSTLMEIYRAESGDAAAEPKSIRGGTYARLFDGAVSFGPSLPGRTYRGHGPDEYLEADALELMLRTTFEATLRLK